MKSKKLIIPLLASMAFIFYISACQKVKDAIDFGEDTALSDDASEAVFDDAFSEADTYSDGNSYKSLSKDSCAPVVTVLRDSNGTMGFPRTITVDFGDNYCNAKNGRQRKGKIIITQSARKFTTGATRSISFVNYFVNDYQIEGTQSITFNGKDDNGNYSWTWKLVGGIVTTPDGLTITRDAEHTRTLSEGADTPRDRWDNVWQIKGSASGVNGNGVAYTRTIDANNPVVRKEACRFAVSGRVTFEREGKSDVVLDYGDGTCDNKATIEAGGETKEITLRDVFH